MARTLDEERDVMARMIADYLEWTDSLSAYWRKLLDIPPGRPMPNAKELLEEIQGWGERDFHLVSKEMHSEIDRCRLVMSIATQAQDQARRLADQTGKEV